MSSNNSACAILFSGGTDSVCAAALGAEIFTEIHLLTYYELGTIASPIPKDNVGKLIKHYPGVNFTHKSCNVDLLVKEISYHNYFKNILHHGFFVLSTPGFSSLSWHIHTVTYCIQNNISFVRDGLTKELLHFPGHMDVFIKIIQKFYAEFGITYENPVREWEVPPDQQFIDQLIVDRHGFFLNKAGESNEMQRTTGKHLFDIGLMPQENIKGSKMDKEMQHDCYPFVLFNMLIFWIYLPWHSYFQYEKKMASLFSEKTRWLQGAISSWKTNPKNSWLTKFLGTYNAIPL